MSEGGKKGGRKEGTKKQRKKLKVIESEGDIKILNRVLRKTIQKSDILLKMS